MKINIPDRGPAHIELEWHCIDALNVSVDRDVGKEPKRDVVIGIRNSPRALVVSFPLHRTFISDTGAFYVLGESCHDMQEVVHGTGENQIRLRKWKENERD